MPQIEFTDDELRKLRTFFAAYEMVVPNHVAANDHSFGAAMLVKIDFAIRTPAQIVIEEMQSYSGSLYGISQWCPSGEIRDRLDRWTEMLRRESSDG